MTGFLLQFCTPTHLVALLVGVVLGISIAWWLAQSLDKAFEIDERLG